MDIPVKSESKTSKLLKLFLKIAVSIICLWYVSGKIDFSKAGIALRNANWVYLIFALVAFVISKLVSSIRLNIYFKNIGIHLPEWQNAKLYWLGMFYNLFLPGSISGDAYKVILLTRKYNVPYKKTAAAVLLDRFSGLLGLGLILAIYSIIVLNRYIYIAAIIVGVVLGILILYFILKKWLKDFLPGFLPTLMLGIVVQALQVVCAYLIMASLNIPFRQTQYIFLFLVSSIVAVLPLTIGGLGARELVFLEGSKYFGLIKENSVVISILFYLITLFTSAWGLIYVFRNPLKEKRATKMSP
ncbi:MAG: flippase-like domain-containing protein [Bacteroidia bacterium]|nr:flippase-like domain-containing protein [Bacteroidia bacterium]